MTDRTSPPAETNAAPLSEVLALARSLARDPENLVDPWVLTHLALRAVPRARSCGISLVLDGPGPETLVSTDSDVAVVDELQHRLGEGPLLDATHVRGGETLVVRDLATDPRWPRFGPQCASRTGLRAVLLTPLDLDAGARAAVGHYAPRPGAFDDAERSGIEILVPYLAMSVRSGLPRRDVAALRAALSANREVGTATGILMAHHGATSAEAFDLLRTASEALGRELHHVAREVMVTGRLPAADPPVAPAQAPGPVRGPDVTR